MVRAVAASASLALLALLMVACAPMGEPPAPPAARGGVTFVPPRCAAASSCLLGQVVTAETASPLARAAVFLEREPGAGASVRIQTLTDDQGVFAVIDAPQGQYRIAIYKDARRVEARGLRLGEPGTTMVPVRLPPG